MICSSSFSTRTSSYTPLSTGIKVSLEMTRTNHRGNANVSGYHSWRRLGDITSSLFALGYHEKTDIPGPASYFVEQMRKAAFARIYSADKNLAAFLGRPPRVNRRFCHFQIPASSPTPRQQEGTWWNADDKIDYTANARWSALCAVYKEEILELARENDSNRKVVEAR